MTAKDYFAAYVQSNISKENSSSFSLGEQNAQGLVRDNASVYRSHLFSATAYYKHLFSEDEELELYASIRTTEPTTPTAWKRSPKGWEAQTSSNISVGTTKDH